MLGCGACACSGKRSGLGSLDGLGDIFCTTPMCSAGQASVQQMLDTFQALGSPSQYSGQVAAIKSSFDAVWPGSLYWLEGFNPACCTVRDIGVQADQLTAQMQPGIPGLGPASQNQSGAGSSDYSGLITLGIVVAAGFALMQVRGLVGK